MREWLKLGAGFFNSFRRESSETLRAFQESSSIPESPCKFAVEKRLFFVDMLG